MRLRRSKMGRSSNCSLYGAYLFWFLKLPKTWFASDLGPLHLKLRTAQVALENNVTLSRTAFQLAHDRATFMPASKVQKLLESGGAAGYCIKWIALSALVTPKNTGTGYRVSFRFDY